MQCEYNINVLNFMNWMSWSKSSIKTILTALVPYRNLAEAFLTILEETNDEEFENQILLSINQWIKKIKSNRDRAKIKNKIKELQKKSNYENKKDKEEADQILSDFINNMED